MKGSKLLNSAIALAIALTGFFAVNGYSAEPIHAPEAEVEEEFPTRYEIRTVRELVVDSGAHEAESVSVEGWVRGMQAPDPQSGIKTGVILLGDENANLEVLVPEGMLIYIHMGDRISVFGEFHAFGEETATTRHYGPNIKLYWLQKLWKYDLRGWSDE